VDNHKADIALYLDDKTIFIEIDEIGHLYSPKKEQDELFEAHFEEQRQEHEFLYRVDDRFIMDDPEESVAFFLNTSKPCKKPPNSRILPNPQKPPKKIFFIP
jgi:hypothetical protein